MEAQKAQLAVPTSKVIIQSSIKEGLEKKVVGAVAGEKVPEHARNVFDDEQLAKELMDLKKKIKEIY